MILKITISIKLRTISKSNHEHTLKTRNKTWVEHQQLSGVLIFLWHALHRILPSDDAGIFVPFDPPSPLFYFFSCWAGVLPFPFPLNSFDFFCENDDIEWMTGLKISSSSKMQGFSNARSHWWRMGEILLFITASSLTAHVRDKFYVSCHEIILKPIDSSAIFKFFSNLIIEGGSTNVGIYKRRSWIGRLW